MKPLKRKLTLKSQSIASLDNQSMMALKGGDFTVNDPTCVNFETCNPAACPHEDTDGCATHFHTCPPTCQLTVDPANCGDTINNPNCVYTNPIACESQDCGTASDVLCC